MKTTLAASSASSTSTGQKRRWRGHDGSARDRADEPVHRQRVVVRQVGDQPAVAQHGDLVAEPQHLLELGGDEQDRHARRRRARPRAAGSAPSRRRRCRASARRGSAAFGSVISQRASSTFCWLPPLSVPTGCSGLAGRMSSAAIHFATSSSWRRRGIGLRPAAGRLQRQHDVLAHGQLLDEPFGAAVLGAEGDAVRRRRRARCAPARPRPRRGRGRRDRRRTAAAPPPCARSRAARRSPTTSPRRSSRSNGAIAPSRPSPSARSTGAALQRRPARPLLERLQRLRLAAEHARDELDLGELGDGPLADAAAVAQHGHAVGDLVDLVEEVRDEDDRRALPP